MRTHFVICSRCEKTIAVTVADPVCNGMHYNCFRLSNGEEAASNFVPTTSIKLKPDVAEYIPLGISQESIMRVIETRPRSLVVEVAPSNFRAIVARAHVQPA